MPYQNDLSTLAQVVGPAAAAQQAGIQAGQAQQEQDLANQKAAAQLPFAGPMAQADLNSKIASTGMTNAQTEGMGLSNLFKQQTMPGEINKTNSVNMSESLSKNAQNVSTIGSTLGTLAGYLDNVPEPARPAAFRQMVESYGIPFDKVPPSMQSGDPNALRSMGQSMVQMSAPYLLQQQKGNQEYTKATDVANIGADARVSSAEATANARIQAAQISKQMHEQQQTFEQAAVRLQSTNPQLAQQYAQAALQLRQAQAGITNTLVTGQGLQMPDLSVGSPSPQASGGAGGGAPAQSALEAEMKRRGLIK